MEYRETATTAAAATTAELYPSSLSTTPPTPPPVSSSPPASPHLILSPCAACKMLRRRCIDNCIMAPYFPPDQPLKFTIAHRVFGASNIIKLLRDLPEPQRADAVTSMVYEANARVRDPVYGCAGSIFQLQKHIGELQVQLAKAQAQILNMQCQNAELLQVLVVCNEIHDLDEGENYFTRIISPFYDTVPSFYLDESILGVAWEPLWT